MNKATATAESINGTILAVITTVGGLIVGLGIISSVQEGLIVAATTAGIAAAAVIANAIHTNSINPTAIQASVVAVVAQVLALVVSFGLVDSAQTGSIIAVASAVVLAAAVVAHAIIAKQLTNHPELHFASVSGSGSVEYHLGDPKTSLTLAEVKGQIKGGPR